MSEGTAAAVYHLPGLFEFFGFYRKFLPLYSEHREWFYDWCRIGSIYGAPENSLWGGGRTSSGKNLNPEKLLNFLGKYGISGRLTFSNSLLREEHLSDSECNGLCDFFEKGSPEYPEIKNGVIVHSELLTDYLRKTYPELYLVSSTTKVLTDFSLFKDEIQRPEFRFVVPDFRLNRKFDLLKELSQPQKDKVEFLCNECCWTGCSDRKACYENVSRKNLGEEVPDFNCRSPGGSSGYRFSEAMKGPDFIGLKDIQKIYLPAGFTNFKIEGRGLGSAVLLEFLLYYMTRPEYQLQVRESLYLDSMLDLF